MHTLANSQISNDTLKKIWVKNQISIRHKYSYTRIQKILKWIKMVIKEKNIITIITDF